MTGIAFADLAQRLTQEALQLFREMGATHLESTGDRRFMRSDSLAGTAMHFVGKGSRRSFRDFDGGALTDLANWGLLHVEYGSRGTPNYRVSGEGLQFYKWLVQSSGEVIAQVDDEVRRLVDGVSFALAHPGSAHHLREAFNLLWGGRTDEQVVSEIGDHLRKALMDATSDVVGAAGGGGQEKPVERLEAYLVGQAVPSRERAVLVQIIELVRITLRLDHRLNHVRDERDRGEEAVTWEEMRRAAFATALACYELDRLAPR